MFVVCFDLEGVFIPEIWISVAEATEIDELKLTTRDEPDYDKLMKKRIEILKNNNITLKDIQEVIMEMGLLPGAEEFMNWIRSVTQVAVITDNYKEFLKPFLKKLGYPLCFHHQLEVDEDGIIIDYHLTKKKMKKKAVQFFQDMNYKVIAVGDSYNDIEMLKKAEFGILFKPPSKVAEEYPEFPVVDNYSDFKKILSHYLDI
ncbi:MAG: bifunctional phosphoserine phosphatase/homoserine phosphotransferase ThrH [Promethearchaeota archaeon]|nr:MAG: bifunctional phosphoserine phosphatase/homoserine phosphotransferase ThrH [Candidatus Lokiarchaeota archaeon]